ncbi:hypothetical protein C8R46DRAFT_1208951 [Mycena filopes]|nr:hypothetical protein C8R46DRAFT_1208951 [Mycena filopes]
MSTVPYELIAAIVDELEDDRAALKSCSLVGRLFCSPSQRHLFHSMWLHRENWQFYTLVQQALQRGTTTPSGTMKKVSGLLSESPHLAAYVRDLTIDLPDSADEDIPLARILEAVPNLERFVISGLVVRWGDLSPPLSSAILDAWDRPALKKLHLVNMRDVPASAVLGVLSSLKVLSLHHSTLGEEEESPAQDGPPPSVSPLEHLILSTGTSFHLLLGPQAPKLLNIRRLFIPLTAAGDAHGQRLLSSVAATLTHLEVNCGDLFFLPRLPELPHLQSLTMHVLDPLARRLPHGFAHTLAGLPAVSLTLVFGIQRRLVEGSWGEDVVPWLAEECPLKGLLHCQLRFVEPAHNAGPHRDGAFAAFSAAVRAALPGARLEFSRVDKGVSYIGRLP